MWGPPMSVSTELLITDLVGLNDRLNHLLLTVKQGQHDEAMICGVATATHGLLNIRDVSLSVDQAISIMGIATGVDAISMYDKLEGETPDIERSHRCHTWKSPQHADARLDLIDHIALPSKEMSPWTQLLTEGRVVSGLTREMPPTFREILQKADVASFLLSPIFTEGTQWGSLGFFYMDREHVWTKSEQAILLTLSVSIGSAIERQRAEEQRLIMQRRLMNTQKHESLSLLAQGIVHDVRNLLLVIQSAMDLKALAAYPGAEGGMQLEIRRAVLGISELVNQLSLYAGNQTPQMSSLRLDLLVRDTLDMVRPSFPKKVYLDLSGLNAVPAINADHTQIRQVVLNLVINALEALDGEGGTITILTEVFVLRPSSREDIFGDRAIPPGSYVCFEIKDTGRGFDEQTKTKIFDPFFSTKPNGTGMGLATVDGVVRSHNGFVIVDSQPGAGTKFRVLLPLAPTK